MLLIIEIRVVLMIRARQNSTEGRARLTGNGRILITRFVYFNSLQTCAIHPSPKGQGSTQFLKADVQ